MKFIQGLGLLLVMLVMPQGQAVIDIYGFDDPRQQARFEALSDELRCPKCLNTNLSGSDAPIAEDLRREIYRLINQGKSDSDIKQHLVARYGDFILYKPPLRGNTALLWLGPLFLAVIALLILLRVIRGSRVDASDEVLSGQQQQQLDQLLENNSAQNSDQSTKT